MKLAFTGSPKSGKTREALNIAKSYNKALMISDGSNFEIYLEDNPQTLRVYLTSFLDQSSLSKIKIKEYDLIIIDAPCDIKSDEFNHLSSDLILIFNNKKSNLDVVLDHMKCFDYIVLFK